MQDCKRCVAFWKTSRKICFSLFTPTFLMEQNKTLDLDKCKYSVSHSDCSGVNRHRWGRWKKLQVDHRISFLVPSSAQPSLQEVDDNFDLGQDLFRQHTIFQLRVSAEGRSGPGSEEKPPLQGKPCQLLFLAQEAKQLN